MIKWYRIWRNEKKRKERLVLVRENILPLFKNDEPWVQEGTWSWYKLDSEPLPLSLVFIDKVLIIQVHGPNISQSIVKDGKIVYLGDKKKNDEVSRLRTICRQQKISLLEIYWNADISTEFLKSKLELLGIELPKE